MKLPVLVLSLLVSFSTFVAAASPLNGRVVDPDGRPVAGARVFVLTDGRVSTAVITNTAGEFTVELPESGEHAVHVAADGFHAAPLAVEGGTERNVGDIRLALSAVSESVVVSAAQVEIPLSRTASTVTIITGEELDARQIHSVADALRSVPGLTVAATGGPGAVTGVFPRGGESNYTLVMLDDVPVNAFGGDFDFGHLSTVNIERIEIVRGPQSALFGSNAIGAVVRIVSKRGGPPSAAALVEAGGYETVRLAGASSGSRGPFEWGASVDRLTTDNHNGQRTSGGLIVSNNGYERTSGTLSAGWRGAASSLRAQLNHTTDERGFPGPFGSNPIGAYTEIDVVSRGENRRTSAALAGGFALGRARGSAVWAYNSLASEFASPFGGSESNSNRWLGRAQIDVPLAPQLELSAGVELQRERAGSTFITGAQAQPVQVKRRISGYFTEGRWNPSHRLSLTAGVRVDDIHRERLEEAPSPFSPRPVLEADSVVSVNPRAAAAWQIRGDGTNFTRVRASAAAGIRPPDGFELAFTDNPRLKPERSRSAEAAIEQALAGGRAVVEAIAFHSTYDDLIVSVGSFRESSRFRTDNIANARTRGIEIGFTARHRAGAIDGHARIGYTFLDSELLAVDGNSAAPPPFEVGQPLLRRPRHQVAVNAGVSSGRVTAFLSGGARSRALDVEPSFGTFGGLFDAEGFSVWNAGAAWRLHRTLEIHGRVENLFDRTYEEALGFPALGRRATIGLRVAAGR